MENDNWNEIRYIHIPSNKIYKLNGAGGLLREDGSTNASLPLWIKENSKDWILLEEHEGVEDLKKCVIEIMKGFSANHNEPEPLYIPEHCYDTLADTLIEKITEI